MRSRAIVEATANLLTPPVHHAITHRSVAEAAGVSAATVVYRFGSTEDLMAAGIYGVIDRFRRGARRPVCSLFTRPERERGGCLTGQRPG